MMETLFTTLTDAITAGTAIALLAAFAWGVLSIILSPCHLASIPLLVGFIQGQGSMDRRRALALSSLFALGILVSIALIGVVTAMAGRLFGDVGTWGNVAVAIVFLMVGLILADILPLPLPAPARLMLAGRGLAAALVLGLVSGVALGPCTFAFLAPMLAVTFKMAGEHTAQGVMLLAAYGLGHCSIIAAAGASTVWVQRTLDWNATSPVGRVIKRGCGACVIAAGFYLLYLAR